MHKYRIEIEKGTKYVCHTSADSPEDALKQYEMGGLEHDSEEPFEKKPMISLVVDEEDDFISKFVDGANQFGARAIKYIGEEYNIKYPYQFETDMRSCPPFVVCGGNHTVSWCLRLAGVINQEAGCQDDTDSYALVVNFVSKEAGLAFLNRLNAYIRRHI